MRFDLTILGSNAATPAYGRHPTAQVLNVSDRLYLIDCGEGTQMRMNDYHIKRHRIHQIFISHLHGDHIFGLIGLLTSYSLNGRTDALDIFGPSGLKEIIDVQLKHTGSHLSYDLNIHIIDPEQSVRIFEDEFVKVTTIPLIHRVPACGYLFTEQERPLNIIPEKLQEHQIDFAQIDVIKKGADGKSTDGKVIPNKILTLPPYIPRTYAFCSDTAYTEAILPIIKNVDLLYHEATFLHEKLEQAIYTKHTTALQAATIAKKAAVQQLLIGHFSSRYLHPEVLLEEAVQVFPNTALAIEGRQFDVKLRRGVGY